MKPALALLALVATAALAAAQPCPNCPNGVCGQPQFSGPLFLPAAPAYRAMPAACYAAGECPGGVCGPACPCPAGSCPAGCPQPALATPYATAPAPERSFFVGRPVRSFLGACGTAFANRPRLLFRRCGG